MSAIVAAAHAAVQPRAFRWYAGAPNLLTRPVAELGLTDWSKPKRKAPKRKPRRIFTKATNQALKDAVLAAIEADIDAALAMMEFRPAPPAADAAARREHMKHATHLKNNTVCRPPPPGAVECFGRTEYRRVTYFVGRTRYQLEAHDFIALEKFRVNLARLPADHFDAGFAYRQLGTAERVQLFPLENAPC